MAMIHRDYKQDTTPTAVVVTYKCFIGGEPRQVGEELVMPRQDALDTESLGRVKIIGPVSSAE